MNVFNFSKCVLLHRSTINCVIQSSNFFSRNLALLMYRHAGTSLQKYTFGRTEYSNHRFNKNLLFAGILAFFGLEKEKEEDPMITVIKRGILCKQKGEYDKAENILHLALKIAQERQDPQAQLYIFDILANVAFEKEDFPKAEKLFLQVLKDMLAGNKSQDDNSVVEISLKLAQIYSKTLRKEKAEVGFKFCINTLLIKIKEIDLSNVESLTDLEKDTVVLWAMSLEWYARYLLFSGKPNDAKEHYEKALNISEKINGITHPTTLAILNDIGILNSSLKNYETAIASFENAIARSKDSDEKNDVPLFYSNLGCTYLDIGEIEKGEEACKKALRLAKRLKNTSAIEDANECLREVKQKVAM